MDTPIISFHKYDKILAADLYGDLQWRARRSSTYNNMYTAGACSAWVLFKESRSYFAFLDLTLKCTSIQINLLKKVLSFEKANSKSCNFICMQFTLNISENSVDISKQDAASRPKG